MSCPSCGAPTVAGAAFCRSCGSSLTAAASAPPTSAAATAAPSVRHDSRAASAELVGRTCPYCRFPLKQDGQVTECGCCHAIHHDDCFSENGGCAVAGCQAGPGGAYSPTGVAPAAMATAAIPGSAAQAVVPTPPPNAGMGTLPPLGSPFGPPQFGPPPVPRRGAWKAAAVVIGLVIALGGAGAALAIALGGSKQRAAQTVTQQAYASTDTATTDPTLTDTSTDDYTAPSSSDTSTESSAGTDSPADSSSGSSADSSASSAASRPRAATSAGPARILRKHLNDLNSGDPDAAFALMAPAYRAANPGWPSARSQASPTIRIVSVGPANQTGSTSADVPVDFYAQDSTATPGSDTKCREFTGTAHMEKIQGVWRYAPAGNSVTATAHPGSDCS